MALAEYACGQTFRYGSRSSSRVNVVQCTRTLSRINTVQGFFLGQSGIVDLDRDQKPDTHLGIDQSTGKPVMTEDEDSYNIDVDGDGVADHVFPKQ